jgi:small basic protein
MSIKDFWSNLWISILTAPIVWAITVIFSNSIAGAISAFAPEWYVEYWYLGIIALVMGIGIQSLALWSAPNVKRNMLISLFVFAALAATYAVKQILGDAFPLGMPLLSFFFIFSLAAAQLVAICIYVCVAAIKNIL